MNDEIIRIAREAGLPLKWISEKGVIQWEQLERFRAIVAAVEREACAKVCEERAGTVSMFATARDAMVHNQAVKGDAKAIRARGNV